MKTIIVIPTYNEAQNIKKLVEDIFALNIDGLEILIVDDNSPDNTSDIVNGLRVTGYGLHLLTRPTKLGLGSAYLAGFKKALELEADYIFEMDADFSHNPNDIPRLLKEIENCDLVIGSRKITGGKIVGWNWIRKFNSTGAMWFSRLILGLKIKDVTAGFRCFRSGVLQTINLDKIHSNGYAFQEELLYRTQLAEFKICEIPVTFIDRQMGKSKLSNKDILEFFITMIKLKLKLI